ncbi:hypothetical protein Tco_0710978 [Tanacetum coccineum]
MDANKKVDLEHVQCPPERKILTNIIKNHPLRFSIAASSFVPWIYMAQFWHTLKEDSSKYRLKFMLDKKELSLTLDDFRTIFYLPHANDNNHNSFVPPPSFFDMVPFYKQQLGFTIKLKTSSSFKTTGLLQPWQTLCKEARENVELVNKHLESEEIEKMIEGSENVIDDSLPPRNDEPKILDTRLEPRSDKESPKVEITNDEEVEITNVVIPINVNEEEDEITDEVYELKRREKGKIVEESRNTQFPTPSRSPRTHTNLGRYTYLFEHLKERFLSRKSFDTLADHLQEVMVESLPQVKNQVLEQVRDQVPVINITTAELVTTASAPVATASVFVSTTEPSTPPTTTTLIEDKDLTIAQTLMKMRSVKSKEKSMEKGVFSETATRLTRGVVMEEASETATRPIRHFARLRVEEKKRKPPTKAQKMNQMCTYLKNIARFTHNQLKNKSFDEIQKAFDKTMSWINSFVPMDSEVVEGYEKKAKSNGKKAESSEKKEISKKRACKKLSEESVKRQKLEDDAEKARLKACLEIVLGDDSAVNIESIATKYPIVDWKTHILAEDKIQDVLDMYRLAKERFETTSTEGYDTLLWGDLITLFEPKNKYSLTQEMLSRMLSGRLEVVMSVKWLMSLSDLSNHSTKSEEMFGYIFLVKIRLLIKKLEDSEVTTAGEV